MYSRYRGICIQLALFLSSIGTGSESVKLWLNTETYDTLNDATRGLGFKIYIHDNDETPVSTDHYFYVSPGNHYDVAMSKGWLA